MKTLLLLTLAGIALISTSCNTFIGLGRDMRIAGEAMEKSGNRGGGEQSGAPIY